ncbi:MAG: hypothetical protein K2I67_03065 [Malacoplasma sp.]|nr:hypothetical protein [Malacoplasma sp.]
MKTKKISLKKTFLSISAVFLLSTAVSFSSYVLNINNISNNYLKVTKNDAKTETNSSITPQLNDLYNEYSCKEGFVKISDSSTINFYNWFGIEIWKYNVISNSDSIFGNLSEIKINTLNVKIDFESSFIYVYGTLNDSNSTSFVFKLNVTNGLLVPFGNKNSFISSGSEFSDGGLIQNVNLLTLTKSGYVILTQKTLVDNKITFSELSIEDNTLISKQIDVTNMTVINASYTVSNIGEIIHVQKSNNLYNFNFKVENTSTNSSTKGRKRVAVQTVEIKNDAYYQSGFFSFHKWTTENIDLDEAIFNIQDVSTTKDEQKVIVSMKYDTTSLTITPNSNPSYICLQTLTSTTLTAQVQKWVSVNGTLNNVAGISGFLFDYNSKKPYVILAHSTSTSTFAIAPLTYDLSTSSAVGWLNLDSSLTSSYQQMNIGFIPNTNKDGKFYGYVEIKKQDNINDKTINSNMVTLFNLDSSGTSLTQESNVNFSLSISDDEIFSKYSNGSYSANEETKNKLLVDLAKIKQNGSEESSAEVSSENLSVDKQNNIIKGKVIISLDNWWNSNKTQITRNVNLSFGSSSKPSETPDPTPSETLTPGSTNTSNSMITSSNVMLYSSTVLIALMITASVLIIFKVIQTRKNRKLKKI